jgi:hypothetical protein
MKYQDGANTNKQEKFTIGWGNGNKLFNDTVNRSRSMNPER